MLCSSHLRGLGDVQKRSNLPEKLDDVLAEINAWIALFCAVEKYSPMVREKDSNLPVII
jgi:hypothetical protein